MSINRDAYGKATHVYDLLEVMTGVYTHICMATVKKHERKRKKIRTKMEYIYDWISIEFQDKSLHIWVSI